MDAAARPREAAQAQLTRGASVIARLRSLVLVHEPGEFMLSHVLSRPSVFRFVALLCLLCAGLFATSPAFAYGKVVWKKTTLKEHTKKEAWYLELEIHLPKPPDIAHKSMKFEFQQLSEYERALVDGKEEPVERTIPLTNQQALIESQSVGFMDPGTGQIQNRTRFSFKVTRAHGYRAGQWQVKIKDGDTGQPIGYTATLNFTGENPVIDRRSIVFQGKEKKEKKEAAPEESSSQSSAPEEPAPADEPAEAPAAAADDEMPEGEGPVPPSIEEKPGGGCHHGPAHGDQWGWAILALLIGIFLYRRIES